MKGRFLRSLILGVCCSLLFVGGSFANVCEHRDVDSNFEQKEEYCDEDYISYQAYITSEILELSVDGFENFEGIVCLGDKYGEDAGYYLLDVDKSFYDVEEVKGTRVRFTSVGVTEECMLIIFGGESGGGIAYICKEATLFSDPSNTYKVNRDGKDYLVLEENGRELYWEKVTYEDILNGSDNL